MTTFQDIQNEIADETDRHDLLSGGQIAKRVKDAIKARSEERYWFNETDAYTFATVGSQDTYTLAPDPGLKLQEFITIDRMEALVGGQWREMCRVPKDEMASLKLTPHTGQPQLWNVFGEQVQIYPTPNDVYTIRVTGHYRFPELNEPADTNAWLTVAGQMIRSDALALVYAFVRNYQDAQSCLELSKAFKDALVREHSRRTATGRIRPWC